MAGFLLDTNHLSAVVEVSSSIRERIYQAQGKGIRIGTCVPALCELECGFEQSRRRVENRRDIRRFLSRVRIWPLDLDVARHYGEIFNELSRRGRVLSQVDMMLAALSRHMSLTILTTDRDFEALPDLRIENWLA